MKCEFTAKEIENLSDWLCEFTDCGPVHAGWDSQELIDMRVKLSEMLKSVENEM